MSVTATPTVHFPGAPPGALQARLAGKASLLVACYCAAWCDACRLYQPKFAELAQRLGQHAFVWIDIEDHPELLGEEEVENFPTLLVQAGGRTLFFGPMLPHIGHLERLLASLDPQAAPSIATTLPDLGAQLAR